MQPSVDASYPASMVLKRWSAGRLAPNHDFDGINYVQASPLARCSTVESARIAEIIAAGAWLVSGRKSDSDQPRALQARLRSRFGSATYWS